MLSPSFMIDRPGSANAVHCKLKQCFNFTEKQQFPLSKSKRLAKLHCVDRMNYYLVLSNARTNKLIGNGQLWKNDRPNYGNSDVWHASHVFLASTRRCWLLIEALRIVPVVIYGKTDNPSLENRLDNNFTLLILGKMRCTEAHQLDRTIPNRLGTHNFRRLNEFYHCKWDNQSLNAF